MEQAVESARLAVRAIDTLELRHLSLISRKQAQYNIRSVYAHIIDLYYQLYQQTQDPTWAEEAFLLSDRSKSRLLSASLLNTQAQDFAGIPASVLQQEKQLQAEINLYEKMLWEEAESPAPDSSKLQQWTGKRNSLQEAYRSLVLELEREHPAYFHLKYTPLHPRIQEIRKAIPDEETELIGFFIGENQLYVFGLEKQTIRMLSQDWGEQEQKRLEAFLTQMRDRELVENRGYDSAYFHNYMQEAQHWFQYVLEPVLLPTSKRLIILPDGYLGHLPFEMLLTKREDPSEFSYASLPYLFREKAISYSFNAALLQNPLQRRRSAKHAYLGFAPTFQKEGVLALASDTFFSSNRDAFGPLAHNQDEINASAQIWKGEAVLGKEANKSTFLGLAPAYRILHLATHAFTHQSNSQYDALVFSGEEEELLEAHEIYQLQLAADLTILSACNTGLGEWQQGEGIMSLARAFRYAGCPSITMSLWPADDASTSVIMQSYLQQLKEGLSKDQALRQAKLQYLEEHPQTHPFYWATFVQMGDIQALKKKPSWQYWAWIILGVGLMIWMIRRGNRGSSRR